MPSSKNVGESGALNFVRECLQLAGAGELLVRDAEPSQPVGLVFVRPERSVVLPEASYFSRCPPVVKVFFYSSIEIGGKGSALRD